MIDLALAEKTISFDEFKEQSDQICGEFDISPVRTDRSFAGSMALVKRHDINVGIVQVDSCRVVRDQKMLKAAPLDIVFLLYQYQGTSHVANGCWDLSLNAGDMVMVDATTTTLFDFSSGMARQFSVPLPRQEAIKSLGLAPLKGMLLQSREPSGRALARYIEKIATEDVTQDPYEHLVERIQLAVRQRMGNPSFGFSFSEGLTTINDLIERNYWDPEFDASGLARRLGLTSRTLQRFFHQLGTTPREYILHFRLEAARKILACKTRSGQKFSIASTAFDCGFSDLSYFYRTFVRNYGFRPGSIRAQVMRDTVGTIT